MIAMIRTASAGVKSGVKGIPFLIIDSILSMFPSRERVRFKGLMQDTLCSRFLDCQWRDVLRAVTS